MSNTHQIVLFLLLHDLIDLHHHHHQRRHTIKLSALNKLALFNRISNHFFSDGSDEKVFNFSNAQPDEASCVNFHYKPNSSNAIFNYCHLPEKHFRDEIIHCPYGKCLWMFVQVLTVLIYLIAYQRLRLVPCYCFLFRYLVVKNCFGRNKFSLNAKNVFFAYNSKF